MINSINSDSQKLGNASLGDKPCAGRPSTSVNHANKTKADTLIRADRRIAIDELASVLRVSHGSAQNIVESLEYSKLCVRLIPRQLTDEHKAERVNCCTKLRERDNKFFGRLITGDETWIHHYEPKSKRRSMQWRHPTSPKPKKFKAQKSAGEIMATVFWDAQGLILVDFMRRGETINSEAYIETLQKLKARIRRVRPNLEMNKILLQHDNARPHASIRTREAITSFGWTTLPHPP